MNHYWLPTSGKSWILLICCLYQTNCQLFYCYSFRSALNTQTQLATTVCFTAGSLSFLLRLGKGCCEFWHWWCYFWLKNGGPSSTARRKRAVDGGLPCWCSVFRGAAPSTHSLLPLWLPRCRIHVISALPLPPDRQSRYPSVIELDMTNQPLKASEEKEERGTHGKASCC